MGQGIFNLGSEAEVAAMHARVSAVGFPLRGDGINTVGLQGKGLEIVAFLLGENDAVMGIADPKEAYTPDSAFVGIGGTFARPADLTTMFAAASDDWDDIRLGQFTPDGQTRPYPTRSDYLRGRSAGVLRTLGLMAGLFDCDSRFEREFFLSTGRKYNALDSAWDTGAAVVESGAEILGFNVDTDMGADGYGGTEAPGSSWSDSLVDVANSPTAAALIQKGLEYALQ